MDVNKLNKAIDNADGTPSASKEIKVSVILVGTPREELTIKEGQTVGSVLDQLSGLPDTVKVIDAITYEELKRDNVLTKDTQIVLSTPKENG